jgi:hypothetical protein
MTNVSTVGEKVFLANGGIASVHTTHVSLEKGEKVRFPSKTFTIREIKQGPASEAGIDMSIIKQTALKQLDLPVIPTYRKISENEILMTDLTSGGSYSVFSPNNNDPVTNPIKFENIKNLAEMIDECERIYEICMKNDIHLHPDCIFIVMDNLGTARIILGDYDQVKLGSSSMPMVNPLYSSIKYIIKRNLNIENPMRNILMNILENKSGSTV